MKDKSTGHRKTKRLVVVTITKTTGGTRYKTLGGFRYKTIGSSQQCSGRKDRGRIAMMPFTKANEGSWIRSIKKNSIDSSSQKQRKQRTSPTGNFFFSKRLTNNWENMGHIKLY